MARNMFASNFCTRYSVLTETTNVTFLSLFTMDESLEIQVPLAPVCPYSKTLLLSAVRRLRLGRNCIGIALGALDPRGGPRAIFPLPTFDDGSTRRSYGSLAIRSALLLVTWNYLVAGTKKKSSNAI